MRERERERERERRERKRERETSACIRMSCYLESVLKVILGDDFRAHQLLHDKVIDALHAFHRMPKCLN